jgi:hypothetical protein
MNRSQIPNDKFRTDGASHAVISEITHQFWRTCAAPELVCVSSDLDTQISSMELYMMIKQVCVNIQDVSQVHASFLNHVQFYVTTPNVLIQVKNNTYRVTKAGIHEYSVEIMGAPDSVSKVKQALDDIMWDKKLVKISWYYSTSRGTDSSVLHVTNLGQKIQDSYYPWFPQGVDSFIQDYFRNPASVLVLYGPPGTGKTSFLRHVMISQSVNAMVTYDDKVLQKDEFFVDFLTDDEHDVLIVEDADVFLSPRDDGENTMMSKFLNVSDGLIKIPNKKMIFTTNITQLAKIDSALLRPGRCFEAVEFRELTATEAAHVAQVSGQADRDWDSQRAWSLAQVFNHTDSPAPHTRHKMGFV